VRAFDFDPDSVACAEELRRRFAPGARTIENASILDEAFVGGLGAFDVVYAWGVLHHTGHMWRAFENACRLVVEGGQLFVSLYNDEGRRSRRWLRVKRLFNRHRWLRPAVLSDVVAKLEGPRFLHRLARARNPLPAARWKAHAAQRGMSMWRDHVDWAGGLPFEVAKPHEGLSRARARGFSLLRMNLTPDHGANEYLFRRD
jgi:2-polyprenyl-6-hydroxyphenyl methylase/3-demethylubiquinone-9 3-methyltransferase